MKKWLFILFALFFTQLSFANSQVHCLAKMMYMEAKGEGVKGRKAVADAMFNRMSHHEFPNTVCGNLKPSQYQWMRSKKQVSNWNLYNQIYQEANQYYASYKLGEHRYITGGAIFFTSNGRTPAKRAVRSIKIGNHQFFKLRPI